MVQTAATKALDRAGVAYTVTEYDAASSGGRADPGYGARVVDALGLDPGAAGKTLVAELDTGRFVLAVVPVDRSLDLKALARSAGAKRATMAGADDAERLTGSVLGAIAPIGMRTRLDVHVDETLLTHEQIHVSGGRRGVEVSIAPADLIAASDASIGPIAT